MVILKFLILSLAGVFFCVASVPTPIGAIRFEFPFFLVYLSAVRDRRPWQSGLTFFVPSVVFDFIDQQFASTFAHLLVFMALRRMNGLVHFDRVPNALFLGFIAAVVDRAFFGFFAGVKAGLGADLVWNAMLDPAYALTVAALYAWLAYFRPR
ncbi:MAG: hypothetical protein A3G34_09330 [Candidatus Lindowbacteria bacterium RIFCSPLOWO2_12_FULL_62_27]|nr:MAG: hypothetical protein A3I06_07995 [Candidatus Lindowbacteria bacterium RIFCSPLOWO2_02_FULL_62_12]OGH60239.1 MAG: hypothetical protein A3G34_09330 [Candidatus Lindowbacteria bacterium RIFCSPLOWO2_12_FULL_62_27]